MGNASSSASKPKLTVSSKTNRYSFIPQEAHSLSELDSFLLSAHEIDASSHLSPDFIKSFLEIIMRGEKAHPEIILYLPRRSIELVLIYRLFNDVDMSDDLKSKIILQAKRDMQQPRLAELFSISISEFIKTTEVQSLLHHYPIIHECFSSRQHGAADEKYEGASLRS